MAMCGWLCVEGRCPSRSSDPAWQRGGTFLEKCQSGMLLAACPWKQRWHPATMTLEQWRVHGHGNGSLQVPRRIMVWRAARPKVAAKVSTFQVENLSWQRNYCCPDTSIIWGAVWSPVTLVPAQRCHSYTSPGVQWWGVEGVATTTLIFSSLAGWNLEQCSLSLLLVTALGRGMEMWWLYLCGGRRCDFKFSGLPIYGTSITLFFFSQACLYSSFLWLFREATAENAVLLSVLAWCWGQKGVKESHQTESVLRGENKNLGKSPGSWGSFP